MKIAVFGNTLYAGVMSALLSESGHSVYWCSNTDDKENTVQYSFHDENVSRLLDKQLNSGFLHYANFKHVPLDIDVYLFSFNQTQEQQVLVLLTELQQRPIIHPKLMVNASTFGLHSTEKFKRILPEDEWVYLPDIIQEGNALQSFTQAKQLIVGFTEPSAQQKVKELLRPFFPFEQQFLFMPVLDAEFTKLSISGMLATRISYINDLAVVAEKLGIDITSVRQGMAADNRIGTAYLSPGAGFGGENFSHDVLTLANTVANTGVKSQLLAQVWEINEQQKEILFRKLWNYYHGDLHGKTIAIWGASFKENTSSIQHSPIHLMLKALWAQGVKVQLHDPQALEEIQMIYGQRDDLILCQQQYEALENAHGLCVITAWKQYWSPDFKQMMQRMAHPLVLDGRNIYDPQYVKAQQFAYMGVGR
ncbi:MULTISPECIES: nucleotide sugar dehydrogenase [Acinetobacter]|uniref:nucleotide sugar dehydrogenase n=1 Tax=Acinetobacter TaxID=469 RepID=UPI000C61B736|nr:MULTISPECIES: nucleotide sugar dehydrogenase [Acinetobacter]MBC70536.1 UDP-glucose 6-dehydrogenase [Acinetobacter sp.]MBT50183.1 UDP-glucose 6-dehydrogenase [Acinetobacter sp.]HJP47287.1 nucleotide sugar dehydrogenase [Acinetobacter venetianus]